MSAAGVRNLGASGYVTNFCANPEGKKVADTSRFPKNSPEVDTFMRKTMDDIAINQMEVKLNILNDKMTAYDTTPEQKAALKQEYDATKKEYDEAKHINCIA